MELLIPGLLLVALMVYASTRIKRVAAEAFEPETVETDDFILEKPEGFLNVLNRNPLLAFDAYSKDYGDRGAENYRLARAEIRAYVDGNIDAVIANIKESSEVTSEISEVIGELKYKVIEAASVEKGIGFCEFYKIAKSGDRVFELKVKAIEEMSDEIKRKIETILSTFTLKSVGR